MWSASGRTCPFILQHYITLEFFLDVKRKFHGCYVNFALDQLDLHFVLFPNKSISRACKKSTREQKTHVMDFGRVGFTLRRYLIILV